MNVNTRDHARELIASAGITTENVTTEQLRILWHRLSKKLRNSPNYKGTYRMNSPVGGRYMTCRTDQWNEREAVSFNRDGFIGFAGWADTNNVRPILDAIGEWLDILKKHDVKRVVISDCPHCDGTGECPDCSADLEELPDSVELHCPTCRDSGECKYCQ